MMNHIMLFADRLFRFDHQIACDDWFNSETMILKPFTVRPYAQINPPISKMRGDVSYTHSESTNEHFFVLARGYATAIMAEVLNTGLERLFGQFASSSTAHF